MDGKEVGMAGNAFEVLPVPNPFNTNPEVGSPQWWVNVLVRQLIQRQPVLEKRMRYVEGRHDKPKGDPAYMEALRKFQKLAATNFVGMITSAPVERMRVSGFCFGDPGAADEDAAAIWNYNDMDMQSATIHMHAATFGLGYALVTPPDEGEKWPTITAEDPRTAIIYKDPMRPTKALAGLRMWSDDIAGKVLAVLYLPEGAYGFIGPDTSTLENLTLREMQDRLTGNGLGMVSGGFKLAGFIPNPDGFEEIPLIEYVWRPDTGDIPWGECGADVITIQDRLNQTIYDRIAISYYAAYPQRYATGMKSPQGADGRGQGGRTAPNKFKPGVNRFWSIDDPTAKFGQFEAADINQILASCEADISHMAAISKTPPHYFMGKMSNISGETLTQAETGLSSKTQMRMTTVGWSHVRLLKMCFAFMDDARKDETDASVMWFDPQKELTADLALAGQQWASIGIPLELIMERLGFTPVQIAFAKVEQAKQEAKEQAQAQQQMSMQQDHQMALAKVSATASPQQPKAQGAPAGPAKPPAQRSGVNKKAKAAKNPTPKNGAKPTAKPTVKPN